ncbi:MAG TPA: META domain-containing protein [Gaiellaceae bacterium]|nr:META domain-containing protein [Gaiellaceae bacterium]
MRLACTCLVAVLLAAGPLLSSGCGGDDDGDSLEGTEWTLVSGVEMPPDAVPTLSFDSDVVRGRAVCNDFGGPYELDGDSIEIGEMDMTAVGCGDRERERMEETYLSVFAEVDHWSVEGERELVLTSDGDELLRYAATIDP